jgi:superfamily II DNA or RNA helicase
MKSKLDKIIEGEVKSGKMLEGELKTYFYIGEMKRPEREEAEKLVDILFATYAMAKEGLDIERLNTVVLATSQKDVIQSVGRAMRKILTEGDLRPLIIDFSDYLSAFISHTKKRKAFYSQSKFIIEDYYLLDSKFADREFEINDNMTYDISLNVEKVLFEEIKEGDKDDNSDEDKNNVCKISSDESSDESSQSEDFKDKTKTKKKKTKTPTKKVDFKKRLF